MTPSEVQRIADTVRELLAQRLFREAQKPYGWPGAYKLADLTLAVLREEGYEIVPAGRDDA